MKKFLALVLALVMTMSLVTISAGADFTDDEAITYGEAVDVMTAIGVVGGYADGSFNPKGTLTRGAAAKIICNMILGPTEAGALATVEAPFADVPADHVFAGYIAYCVSEGIVSGYSDGTFRPAGTLTGYAFWKMLLGALGYDAVNEGYTGANYAINVAKRGLNIGLDAGLSGAFSGGKALTREEACLYAFNTLKSTMVEYDNNSKITIGDITISNSTKAEEVKLGDAGGYDYVGGSTGSGNAGETVQFCEQYFKKLVLNSSGNNVDNYGRPSNVWTYDGKKVGTYDSKAPALVLTEVTKEQAIFEALGAEGISGGSKYVVMDEIYVDGVLNSQAEDKGTYWAATSGSGDCAESVIIAKGDKTDMFGSGYGVTVEIYKTDVANHYEMVIINEYLQKVNSITKATSGGAKRKINMTMGSFETEEFAKNDYVLVTKSNGAIKSAVAAEKVEDVQVTAYKDNKYVVAGGTTYNYSQHAAVKNTEFKMTAKDSYSFYLDSCGNIISVDEYSVASTDYVLVLAQSDSAAGDAVTGQYRNVKYIDATGKTTVVKTYGSSATVSLNTWYTVAADDDHDGYFKFTAVNTTPADETVTAYGAANLTQIDSKYTLTKTQPQVNANLKANAGTIFVLKTGTSPDAWKVYEGISSVPTYSKATAVTATGVAGKDGYADIIYIDVTTATAENSASDDVAYILSLTPAGKYYDTENKVYYNELNAIVKGEKTTIKVAVDGNRDNAVTGLATGLVKIDTYNANGYVSKVTELTANGYAKVTSLNDKDIAFSAPTMSIEGGSAYSAADAVVYMIDADDVLTVGTVEDLVGTTTASASNVMYIVYASKTDNTVTAIYFDGGLQ